MAKKLKNPASAAMLALNEGDELQGDALIPSLTDKPVCLQLLEKVEAEGYTRMVFVAFWSGIRLCQKVAHVSPSTVEWKS